MASRRIRNVASGQWTRDFCGEPVGHHATVVAHAHQIRSTARDHDARAAVQADATVSAMSGSAAPDELLAARIVGTWQLLRCEAPLEIEPGTRMEFHGDAQLAYVIPTATGPLQVTLRWRVQDGLLHTVHQDGSNPVQVVMGLGDADVLTFDFGGPRAWYVRLT